MKAKYVDLKKVFQTNISIYLKRQVSDEYVLPVLTYGEETVSLTIKYTLKLRVTQRRMERSGTETTLKDKIGRFEN